MDGIIPKKILNFAEMSKEFIAYVRSHGHEPENLSADILQAAQEEFRQIQGGAAFLDSVLDNVPIYK
jgi:hypothetical protein